MTDFFIKPPPDDHSSHPGLALAGQYLKRINTHAMNWFDLEAELNTVVLSHLINEHPIEFEHWELLLNDSAL